MIKATAPTGLPRPRSHTNGVGFICSNENVTSWNEAAFYGVFTPAGNELQGASR